MRAQAVGGPGASPSCCSMLNWLTTPQCSTTLSPRKRTIWISDHVAFLPVAGIPEKSLVTVFNCSPHEHVQDSPWATQGKRSL